MNFRKIEIAFALFLTAILGAACFVYVLAPHATAPTASKDAAYVRFLFLATEGLLALAVVIALCFVLPSLRAQSREHGKLHTLTNVLRRRSKEMEQAALTDVLTGLTNRRYFDETLSEYIEAFDKIGRPLGLMIIDLDHFKNINDTYGHDVGDEVLRGVSKCLIEHTRDHDIVARLGGEEFAVVVPNMDQCDLNDFADRLRLAVERLSVNVGNLRLRITMSIGLAVTAPGENAAGLYKRADINLYNAKQAGRNRICA